jgi:hypothetical protein
MHITHYTLHKQICVCKLGFLCVVFILDFLCNGRTLLNIFAITGSMPPGRPKGSGAGRGSGRGRGRPRKDGSLGALSPGVCVCMRIFCLLLYLCVCMCVYVYLCLSVCEGSPWYGVRLKRFIPSLSLKLWRLLRQHAVLRVFSIQNFTVLCTCTVLRSFK